MQGSWGRSLQATARLRGLRRAEATVGARLPIGQPVQCEIEQFVLCETNTIVSVGVCVCSDSVSITILKARASKTQNFQFQSVTRAKAIPPKCLCCGNRAEQSEIRKLKTNSSSSGWYHSTSCVA